MNKQETLPKSISGLIDIMIPLIPSDNILTWNLDRIKILANNSSDMLYWDHFQMVLKRSIYKGNTLWQNELNFIAAKIFPNWEV